MTIRGRDGFDTYNGGGSGLGLQSRWLSQQYSGSVPTSQVTAGRFGGQAMRCGALGSTSGSTWTRNLDSAISAFSLVIAARFPAASLAATSRFAYLRDTGSFQLGLQVNNNGSVSVNRHTAINTVTSLGSTPPGLITADVWVDIELVGTISDTVGTIDLRINSSPTSHLSLTNQDTRSAGTTVNEVSFGNNNGGASAGNVDIDDYSISDTAVIRGGRRIETLYANADGATLNFVQSTGGTHFGVVDETVANNTDWLSGTNVGDLDLLGLTNLASTPATIDEINAILYSQKTDATARGLAAGIKSGATAANGATLMQAVGFTQYNHPHPLDPNTGLAWTPAAVNVLELQPKILV